MNAYRFINALSLDVVSGALVSSIFFSRLLDTTLPLEIIVVLGLAVWAVYTLDHLWDAHRSKEPKGSFRHNLHSRYFKGLTGIAFSAILLAFVLTYYIPESTRNLGFALVLIIVVYFITLQFKGPRYHKELLVAIIYTSGVVIGPASVAEDPLNPFNLLVMLQFGMLALTNLILFAYFEQDQDTKQEFGSLARSIGQNRTLWIIRFILMTVLFSVLIGLVIFKGYEMILGSQLIITLMSINLGALLYWREHFIGNDRYRLIGDATFLIPLLVL